MRGASRAPRRGWSPRSPAGSGCGCRASRDYDRPVEPFEVLAEEAAAHPVVPLPPELARIYGGDLRFAEECVYANFVATLDGVVAIPSLPNSNAVVAGDNDADRFLMGRSGRWPTSCSSVRAFFGHPPKSTWRAGADLSTCRGAIRRASREPRPAPGARDRGPVRLGEHRPRPSGAPRPDARADERPWRDTAREPTPRHCGVVSLGRRLRFTGDVIIDALRARGHRRILTEAGPHTFGALLRADRVDELFLTTSPFLAGDAGEGSRLRLVEGADLIPLAEEATPQHSPPWRSSVRALCDRRVARSSTRRSGDGRADAPRALPPGSRGGGAGHSREKRRGVDRVGPRQVSAR